MCAVEDLSFRSQASLGFKPSLRVTVTLKNFGQRPINGASFLVDRTRSKQFFHTSQNMPSFSAFYWVTTVSSAKRVSGWPKGRNFGGVTGELRRLGLSRRVYICRVVSEELRFRI